MRKTLNKIKTTNNLDELVKQHRGKGALLIRIDELHWKENHARMMQENKGESVFSRASRNCHDITELGCTIY